MAIPHNRRWPGFICSVQAETNSSRIWVEGHFEKAWQWKRRKCLGRERSTRGTRYQPIRIKTPSYSLPPSAAERDSQPAGVNAPSPRITTDMGPAVWLANSLEGVRESDSRRLTDPVAWPNLQGYPTVARRHWQS